MSSSNKPPTRGKGPVLGARAFAAISAVEGLKLGAASRKRLQSLQDDPKLTPDQRRAEVRKAYAGLSRRNDR
jgi:hypothetical protein